jgi:hypothetical protein
VVSANFTKGYPEGLFVSVGLMLVSKWPSTTEVFSLSSSIIHTSVVIPVPISELIGICCDADHEVCEK